MGGTSYAQTLAGSGGGGSGGTIYQEIPAGSGVNFTVTQAVTAATAFVLFRDGLAIFQGPAADQFHYQVSGTNITLGSALLPGQSLLAVYNIPTGSPSGSYITSVANTSDIALNVSAGQLTAALIKNILGTRAAPQLVTAVGGIVFSGAQMQSKVYVAGSGGPVNVTATPQITAGTQDAQILVIQSTNAVNTVQLNDGNGLALNGPWIGGLNSVIMLTWDTVNWVEISRQ